MIRYNVCVTAIWIPAWLETLDRDLLHLLNCRIASPFLDDVLLPLQSKSVGVPIFAAVLIGLLCWRRRLGVRTVATALIAYGISMGIATLMWTTIERPRPPRVLERTLKTPAEIAACASHPGAVAVRKHVSRRPGLPSRHACSSGAFAIALFLAVRWLGALGIVYAVLVAVGRVYAGVHWPSDVVAGLFIGGLAAWLAWRLTPWGLGLVGLRNWVQEPGSMADSSMEAGTIEEVG